MHELALAEGVIATALETARKEGASSIRKIAVTIGQLQRIEPGIFEQCLTQVMPATDPLLEGVTVSLEKEPARFRCRACERDFGLADAPDPLGDHELEAIHFVPELAHTYLSCPHCGSPDFEVVGGRGVWIDHIEID